MQVENEWEMIFQKGGYCMELQELILYCLQKKGAYLDNSVGKDPILVKLDRKVFAEIYTKEPEFKITLKCEPGLAEQYRLKFPGIVVKGYHHPSLHQPYWNTIYLNRMVEDQMILEMIDHSYDRVIKGFSRNIRKDIEEGQLFKQHMKLSADKERVSDMIELLKLQMKGKQIHIIEEKKQYTESEWKEIKKNEVIIFVHRRVEEDPALAEQCNRMKERLAKYPGKVFEIIYDE